MNKLLLDTCAVLWIANGERIDGKARAEIAGGDLYVSPITAWEIANLVRKDRIALAMPIKAWFEQTIERMRAALPALSVDVLIESCLLPGRFAGDPADRIIIATARAHALTIVTRDKVLLDYARTGNVLALPC